MADPWNLGDVLEGVESALPPDAPALVHDDEVVSWGELARRSRSLAAAFAARGVAPGDKVAFYMRNAPAYMETLAACFKGGYVHVNVIPGREETLHVFNHPAEYGYSVAQLLERIALVQQNMPLHAIEVTAKGFYTPEYDIESLALPKVASDDSHTRDMCGRAWITAQAEREHDAVLRAIKAGQARVHYGAVARQRSWAHFGE